jgi:hypothetical protein
MRWLHRVLGEAMMGLMSGVLGTHEYIWGSRATGHVVATEPSRTRRRVWSCRTCAGTEAFSYQVMGSVPRGTCQHRSPLLVSGAHSALGYMATPEPFPSRWHALCRGARGDTGALFWRVACSVPWGTWWSQSLLAPGTDLESRG